MYLSDYANERLSVQLQLRDLSKGELAVRLRWQIQGPGVSLVTTSTFVTEAQPLGAGIPLRLDGYQLAPYLQARALSGSGLGASWQRQAQLPEGLYQFCVQAVDDLSGAVVSNQACASAWLLRHDPPLLNLPQNNEQPAAREPQQLTFQWTPRHAGRPNAQFMTEYDFRLVEIWPAGRNPNEAMRTLVPFYETTTSATMLMYGPGEPPLVPGRHYAWQVRARSLVNGESLDFFNNQGYSEVYSFRWGEACSPVAPVQAQALSGGRIRLHWDSPSHSSFTVRYRPQNGERWYTQETLRPEVTLTRLDPGTTYEYQVQGYCGSIGAELTALATLTTPAEEVTDYVCGQPLPTTGPLGTNPLPALRVGDLIRAGDFKVTVTESSGQQGRFSGKGTVKMPWLRESVAQVSFQDVQVNEQYRLTEGELVVSGVAVEVLPEELSKSLAEVYQTVDQLSEDLDQAEQMVDKADEVIDQAEELAGQYLPSDTTASTSSETSPNGTDPSPSGERSPDAAGASTPGASTPGASTPGASTPGGATVNTSGGKSATGQSPARGSDAPTIASADTVDLSVAFRADPQQTYGFDPPQHQALATDYEQVLIKGESYPVAWKSVASGRTDYVGLTTEPDSLSASVRFRTATGPVTTAQPSSQQNQARLLVTGTTHQAVDPLTAYVTDSADNETTVGQLNVISYDKLRPKVVIVPVNEASAPNAVLLSQELNRIYSSAVVHWEVVIDEPFVVDAAEVPRSDDEGGSLLASFPRPMRQFNRSFRRSRETDPEAYYLFVVAEAGASRLGFMPFKRQFGYVFTTQADELTRTIAHELGHGAFRLRHPFSERGLAQGTTDNLMDYSQGTALYKYQWNNVHDPEAMVGWLQDDEESAFEENGTRDPALVQMILREIRDSYKHGTKIYPNVRSGLVYDHNIVIGLSTFSSIKIEDAHPTQTTAINVQKLVSVPSDHYSNSIHLNQYELKIGELKIILSSSNEREMLADFLFKNTPEYDYANSKIVVLGDKTYSLEYIVSEIEKIRIKLQHENTYRKLTPIDKLILDLPIIEWQAEWEYTSIFMINWLTESGDIHFDNAESFLERFDWFKEVRDGSIAKLKRISTEEEEKLFATDRQRDDWLKLSKKAEDLDIGEKVSLSLGTSFDNSGNNLTYCYSESIGMDVVALNFGDLAGSFGRLSLLYWFEGNLLRKNNTEAEIEISNFSYRLNDSFDFSYKDRYMSLPNIGCPAKVTYDE